MLKSFTSFLTFLCVFSSMSFAGDKISPETIEGAKTINAAEAKALFEQNVLFVDIRKNQDWDAGRIPEAVHLELKKVFNEETLSEEAQKSDPIVLYCNGEKCLRSSKASAQAVSWGFKNVYYFRDGFPAWKSAGYPVE